MDIESGNFSINTWVKFNKELKCRFYPMSAEDEVRARVLHLQHKGSISDYVKEFTEVLLEIPNYLNKKALFAFMDCLQGWAKQEIQRRGAQDLASSISHR